MRTEPTLGRHEVVPLKSLVAYDGNAKRHTREQIETVKESIKQLGFGAPLVAWHNEDGRPEIVAGHARAKAAEELGIEAVPVVFRDDWTDAQRRAYTLIDNQATMMTGWDEDQLAYELDSLSSEFTIGDFGFDDVDMDGFGTDIDLPGEGDGHMSQASFALSPEQREEVMGIIAGVDIEGVETFGNTNRNGNALYKVVTEWAQRTFS